MRFAGDYMLGPTYALLETSNSNHTFGGATSFDNKTPELKLKIKQLNRTSEMGIVLNLLLNKIYIFNRSPCLILRIGIEM